MTARRSVTVVIHHDGDIDSKTIRMPTWVFRLAVWSSVSFVALALIGAALYTPVLRTAARVPGMNREIARLSAENQQVRQLAQTLDELEARYAQVRTALGANVTIPEPGEVGPGTPTSTPLRVPPPGRQPLPTGASLPIFWPLDSLFDPGVMTRSFISEGADGTGHPGVDIAVRTGTPIRASGGGLVREAGYDPEYGWFVLIDHLRGFQSMYGHASRLLVATGQPIDAGQVIALAGNTGRSTAPHLHFEKRRDGEPIDPLSTVTTER